MKSDQFPSKADFMVLSCDDKNNIVLHSKMTQTLF